MKYTNNELLKYDKMLKDVSEGDFNMPVKVAYAIIKNRQAIENAIKPYNEAYDSIIQKYGKDGIISKNEDPVGFNNATNDINVLLNEMSDDISLRTVSIDAFGDSEIPMKVMTDISFMIE